MRTEKVTLFEKFQYLKMELFSFDQKEKIFYLSKIYAIDLLETYTVEPAEYDIDKQVLFASTFPDDSEYYSFLQNEDRQRIDKKAFQRKEDKTRVAKIKKFLLEEEYALFPNTIIVTCDLFNDFFQIPFDTKISDIPEEILIKGTNLAYLEIIQENIYLYIPYVKSSILIIDGQHRIRGIEEAYKAKPSTFENFELLLSIILHFDKSIIAKLFYTINYTQKSVNKSLLYHLSGEFSRDINMITFLHEVIKILNESEKSPFCKRIKMLGNIPTSIPQKQKDKMTISQAFLIDYLLPTISKDALNSFYPPVFLYYYKKEKENIEIIRFIIKYFSAIESKLQKYWDNPSDNMATKTISIGAFIKVLQLYFTKLIVEKYKFNFEELTSLTVDNIKTDLSGIENIDFSNEGEFGKASSSGNLTKIKVKLVESIQYFETNNYESFSVDFKTKYQIPFRNWFK